MRPKAESIITLKTSSANDLIVLVEFLLNFSSNNGFQLFRDVSFSSALSKDRSDWISI